MNAPAKKLSDLGKQWSAAPGWRETLPRIVTAATLAPRAEPDKPAIEKPADLGAEFRRQYEIWRHDHPARAGDLDEALPAMEDARFDMMRGARIVLIVGGAALAAFYFVGVLPNLNSGGFQPAPPEPLPVKLAASTTKAARLEVPPMPAAARPTTSPPWPEPVQHESTPVQHIEKPDAAPEPAPTPAVTLSAEEIDLMRKRGQEFIASGDLASARLVLERAAKARDAGAAFALASTYDPAVLEELRVYGAVGDVELAIMWYERAKDYGSKDARQRLLALAGRL
jgi:hypothetical protein